MRRGWPVRNCSQWPWYGESLWNHWWHGEIIWKAHAAEQQSPQNNEWHRTVNDIDQQIELMGGAAGPLASNNNG